MCSYDRRCYLYYVMKCMIYNLVLFSVMAIAMKGAAQDVKYVNIKDQKTGYVPGEFYITDVADDRTEVDYIGEVLKGNKKTMIALQGGTSGAIKSFIVNNVTMVRSGQPVSLHISKLNVTARKQLVMSKIEASLMFTIYVSGRKVVEYTSSGEATTDMDISNYIESFIRQAVENDIKKFDEWWKENKSKVVVASSVRTNVTVGRTTDKKDLIVYSTGRPVQIPDFKGRVEGKEAELAVTVSGIGVGYSGQVDNGQVVIDVVITPYFNTALSWFKPQGRNSRVLAHEQAHFDITAIKACELIAMIRKAKFTEDNYEQVLQELQQRNSDESNALQNRYDEETAHGTIQPVQEAWEKKLKEQVRTCGCY